MRKHLLLLLFLGLSVSAFQKPLKAQTLELLGGNTLNGAINGVVLGGATMALQNSTDFEAVRIGLGAGILYGLGVGIYDISLVEKGQQFYISGTFNDGTNSSILVLLDTFYGAAAGAIVASSLSLIVQEPLVDYLQYGTGAGAWLGFGYGLIDAFVLAKGPDFGAAALTTTSKNEVSGLITYSNASSSLEIGMLNPALFELTEITQSSVKTTFQPSLNVIQVNIDF
ncbi:MAG TPA: hypothetical protein VF181_00670 [Balneolaceae bacterium]